MRGPLRDLATSPASTELLLMMRDSDAVNEHHGANKNFGADKN
jgi:hypothetical protein